jgi:ligand-binding sensor domain-containing protein
MRSFGTLSCIVLSLTLATPLQAQIRADKTDDKAAFMVLSIKDGLPNASVSGILQDRRGFIWMSTQGGLCRYDGSGFVVYENEPFNDDSISGDLVQTIYLDEADTLWAGTYAGLNRLDQESATFTHWRFSDSDPSSLSNDLVGMPEASSGSVRSTASTAWTKRRALSNATSTTRPIPIRSRTTPSVPSIAIPRVGSGLA